MILAIDPGTNKLGWALVDSGGHAAGQGIWGFGEWEMRLSQLDRKERIRTVVLGDGTNRLNIEQGLSRLLPHAALAVVDEKESTVEAWKLKRTEEAGLNPWKVTVFMLRQLFSPVPVDDYAARVLALRYLKQGQEPGQ